MDLPPDFTAELRKHFRGEVQTDAGTRALYSTDASIYQMEPLGVALPRTQEDLHAAVELAARYKIPVLARGAGTSLAGQAIGPALILDCSRWLDRVVKIDPEAHSASVEPGALLGDLNRAAEPYGLQFGPDPASAERATLGGVIANNATGAHSIAYGMTADHLLGADVILSDGSRANFGPQTIQGDRIARAPAGDRFESILAYVELLRTQHAEAIKSGWPRVWRNSAGYRLNYMIPWSSSAPDQWAGAYPAASEKGPNLAALLAGSEGTLAVISRAMVNLVPKPQHTILGVLAFASVAAACDAVPELLRCSPSAIELIPQILIRLARTVPAYASQMGWVVGDPAALLVIEFSGDSPVALTKRARELEGLLALAESPDEQRRVWNVRRLGLGLLDSRPQSARPTAFMEDCAVPVERLGDFVRRVETILEEHGTRAGMYAHASGGCLHIRPILDLKNSGGLVDLRSIAKAMVRLTAEMGGVMSSEHGDGLSRSEWLDQTYGPEILELMAGLKRAADPHNLLNPGKIIDPPPMDAHLRFRANDAIQIWHSTMSFDRQGGMAAAIEQCNGQGVCRKSDGVMCPSFQATREEMHSTRGRANLLRALITQPVSGGRHALLHESTAQALDLCLACKGCKAECPSGVDMARLKYAFEAEYYRSHRRPLRDYLFVNFHVLAARLRPFARLTSALQRKQWLRRGLSRMLGIAAQRPLPELAAWRATPARRRGRQGVLYLPDLFTHFMEPHVEQAAFDLMEAAEQDVYILPVIGAGAAYLSKGFLRQARRHVERLLNAANVIDPDGAMPIVGVEPAEVYSLRQDLPDLLPSSMVLRLRSGVWLLEEYLMRVPRAEPVRIATSGRVDLFPHCHQRAEFASPDGSEVGPAASSALLEWGGYQVSTIEAGCCGMAGTFGYESEHYELSQRIGELKLFPRIRRENEPRIAATGASCRLHIAQATGVYPEHPVVLAARALHSR